MQLYRESIFISGIRSFVKVLFGLIGLLVGIFVLIGFTGAMGATPYVLPKANLYIMPNADGSIDQAPMNSPVVLQISIENVIGSPKLSSDTIASVLTQAKSNPLLNKRIKAIMLNINSPGGTATDSYQIYQAIENFKSEMKIPVYGYVSGLCASGAMYIACATDMIYASPASIVGSVGVISGPFFNFSEGMQKIGVSAKTLTMGKDKDSFNPFRPWKADEGTDFNNMMQVNYDLFASTVAKARPKLTMEKLAEYGAQIYSAGDSEKLGYIDNGNATYREALKALVTAANITEQYQVIEVHSVPSLLSDLLENKANMLSHAFKSIFSQDIEMKHPMSNSLLYLYQP
jgi:protease-4